MGVCEALTQNNFAGSPPIKAGWFLKPTLGHLCGNEIFCSCLPSCAEKFHALTDWIVKWVLVLKNTLTLGHAKKVSVMYLWKPKGKEL